MTYHFKNKLSLLSASLGAIALLTGCGGGGGGSTPTPTAAPSPFDASYNATYTPSSAIPGDGRAPSGNLVIARGRGALQTTFYLQPSVVTFYQKQIDDALRSNNVGFAIPDNQIPQNISFTSSGRIDGNGKLVLTANTTINICGAAKLTVSPTFASDGAATPGSGTYEITFPANLVAKVRGQSITVARDGQGRQLTCNNLPLRTGTVTFTR